MVVSLVTIPENAKFLVKLHLSNCEQQTHMDYLPKIEPSSSANKKRGIQQH